MRAFFAIATTLAFGASALAQYAGHQPYAGLQTRQITTLCREQVQDLQNGRGMGLALAAELNGYPGPIHVLDLADELNLSHEKRNRLRELVEQMKVEAKPLGHELLERERALNSAFAARTITEPEISRLTADIGAVQANLRTTHLKYHLTTSQLLSPEQMKTYAELRGYR